MATRRQDDVVDLLLKSKALSSANAMAVRCYAKKWKVSLFNAVLDAHLLSEGELADIVAKKMRIDRVYFVKSLPRSPRLMEMMGFRRSREWECLIVHNQEGKLAPYEAIFADPTTAAEKLKLIADDLGEEVTLAIGERTDILGAIDEHFPLAEQLPELYSNNP